MKWVILVASIASAIILSKGKLVFVWCNYNVICLKRCKCNWIVNATNLYTLGYALANIRKGDGVTQHCFQYLVNKPPLITPPKSPNETVFDEALLTMLQDCECGLNGCKHLDYNSTDMFLTCKETVSSVCERRGWTILLQWAKKPKETDKYCTDRYNHYKKLAFSCNYPLWLCNGTTVSFHCDHS